MQLRLNLLVRQQGLQQIANPDALDRWSAVFRDNGVNGISQICELGCCMGRLEVRSSGFLYFLHEVSMGHLMKELCLLWLETFVKGIIDNATLPPPRFVTHAFKYSISCLPLINVRAHLDLEE